MRAPEIGETRKGKTEPRGTPHHSKRREGGIRGSRKIIYKVKRLSAVGGVRGGGGCSVCWEGG